MLNSSHQNLIYTYSVIVGPKIKTRSPSKVTVTVGNTLFLKCQAEGKPRPLITWSKDGEEVHSRSNDTNFVHESATKDDSGIYECTASNSAGSDSYRIEVIIKGNNLKRQHTVSSLIKHDLVNLPYNLQGLNHHFVIKINAISERRFDRSTVIFKFSRRIKLHIWLKTLKFVYGQ